MCGDRLESRCEDRLASRIIAGETLFTEILGLIECCAGDLGQVFDAHKDDEDKMDEEAISICRETAHDIVRTVLIFKDEL